MLPFIIASTILVSAISLIGIIFFRLREKMLEKVLMMLVAFASGALLGGAFIHMLPESVSQGSPTFLYVLLGILLFFIIEKFLRWRHCHKRVCDVHSYAYMNLIGDGIHNWLDGMIIAAAFLGSPHLGISTTLAVVVHEIPQEVGDFGVLLYGGMSKVRALLYNFLTQVTAIFGALFTYYLAQHIEHFSALLVPVAAGGFIYIAATDLLPELHKREEAKNSAIQFALLLIGIALMWSLKLAFE